MLIENAKSQTTNTLPTIKSEAMGVDEGSQVFLMKAITENLYKHPAVAAARELLSNGQDSRTRAGTLAPVKLTLPTRLNPTLIVEDQGTGMSEGTITRVYKNVFASDKRESKDERGGYGLGSKSPLAVTASFSVVARYNGEERVIIVARDDDNVPVFHTVAVNETDEPNGLTVSVPLSLDDVKEIEENATRLVVAQPEGSVLVNGQWPEESVHNPEQYIPIGDLGWFKLSQGDGPAGEVLGVYYDIDSYFHGGVLFDDIGKRAVLRLPNSDTKLETSRESIRAISHNRDLITDLATKWREGVMAYLQEHVDSMNRREAYLFSQTFDSSHGLTVGDEEIPRTLPYYDPTAVEEYQAQQRASEESLGSDEYVPRPTPLGLYSTDIGRGSRPTATRIESGKGGLQFTPSDNRKYTILKVEDDAESRRVALRDIKDYELARQREHDYQGQTYFLLTEKNGTMLSRWFLAFAEFGDLDEIERVAKEERRERRRESAARRVAAPKRDANEPKPPRIITFAQLTPAKSSDSNRARLLTETVQSDTLSGKVAYIVALAETETANFGYDLARIVNRTARHPGKEALSRASLYVAVLNRLGYTVVALRQNQKPEELEGLDGIEPVDALDLVEEAHSHILSFFDDIEFCSSLYKQPDQTVFDMLVSLDIRKDYETADRAYLKKLVGAVSSGSTWRDDDYTNIEAARDFLKNIGVDKDARNTFIEQYQKVLDARISRRYPLLTGVGYNPSEKKKEHIRLYVAAVDSMSAE